MPSTRSQGVKSRYDGDPNYRNTSKGRERHKTSKPKAERSAMLGSEFVTELAKLNMSINEFCRAAGMNADTGTRYASFTEPGHMPVLVDIALRYARIDPWFGRRFRPDGKHGYVNLRGSDRVRWSEMMDAMEDLSAAMVQDDIDQTIKAGLRLGMRLWLLVKHLREVEQRMLAADAERGDG